MTSLKEFEMTQEDFDIIVAAGRPVPMIALQCGNPRSPQQNVNDAWDALGKKMGFIGSSAEPCAAPKNHLCFQAYVVGEDEKRIP